MNFTESIFFSLLNAGLTETEDCNLAAFGQISDESWLGVMQMAVDQGLAGVVFSGIEKLPKTQFPSTLLRLKWLGKVEQIKRRNEDYRKNAKEFLQIISRNEHLGILQNELKVFVLKGMACESWYPKPDRRSLGDLDVYLCENSNDLEGHFDACEKCNMLVQELGLPFDLHDYKHAHISFNGLSIENHLHLTEFRGFKENKKAEQYLQELLCRQSNNLQITTEGYIIPDAQFNALFLTIHAFNHFISEGISVRHACDWAMFLKQNQHEVDWNEFSEWTKLLGMSRFANAMTLIAHDYLGVQTIHEPRLRITMQCVGLLIEDMLYGQRKLDYRASDWGFRWKKTMNFFRFGLRFKPLYDHNVLWYYLKFCWGFVMDKNPRI